MLRRGRWYGTMPAVPLGYEYMGPCVCGFGPHAFYTTPEGTVVHASQVFAPYPAFPLEIPKEEELEILSDEADMLEKELAHIKKRIEELEKEVK